MQEAVLRVDVIFDHIVVEKFADIAMQEIPDAQAGREKEEGLGQFVNSDQPQDDIFPRSNAVGGGGHCVDISLTQGDGSKFDQKARECKLFTDPSTIGSDIMPLNLRK